MPRWLVPQSFKRPFLVWVVLAQSLVVVTAASALSFYTVGGGGLLMRIDLDTGVGDAVGPTGLAFPVEAATFGSDDRLYVAVADPSGPALHVVDPDTGDATLIGAFGLAPGLTTSSLVFDAEGRLWMSVNDFMADTQMLYCVDTASGAASLEHVLERPALALAARQGEVYAITPGHVLEELDVETGLMTPVFELGLDELLVRGASFDPSGKLRVSAVGGGILVMVNLQYFVVDLASAEVTATYEDGYFFGLPEAGSRSVAMRRTPGVDIPSLGAVGWALLSAGLLGFGLLQLLRRPRRV